MQAESVLNRNCRRQKSFSVPEARGIYQDMSITTMNVSTRYSLSEEKLALFIKGNRFPSEYDVHICAFFGEVPLSDIMRFCLKQGVGLGALKCYYENHVRNRCPSKSVEEMLQYAE